jgi:hypothetical protein
MSNYLLYVGVPIEIEAEDEEEAIRLARHTVYNNLSNYDIYDFGVEIIEED